MFARTEVLIWQNGLGLSSHRRCDPLHDREHVQSWAAAAAVARVGKHCFSGYHNADCEPGRHGGARPSTPTVSRNKSRLAVLLHTYPAAKSRTAMYRTTTHHSNLPAGVLICCATLTCVILRWHQAFSELRVTSNTAGQHSSSSVAEAASKQSQIGVSSSFQVSLVLGIALYDRWDSCVTGLNPQRACGFASGLQQPARCVHSPLSCAMQWTAVVASCAGIVVMSLGSLAK